MLKQRVLELEAELCSLRQASFSIGGLTNQVSSLTRYCSSVDAVEKFSMKTLWKDIQGMAPDLIHLLQVVGDCTRNVRSGGDDGPLLLSK